MQEQFRLVVALMALFLLAWAMPVFGQDAGIGIIVTIAASPEDVLDPHTVLNKDPVLVQVMSNDLVNIRMEPNTSSAIIGKTVAKVLMNAQVFIKAADAGSEKKTWDLVRLWTAEKGEYVGFGWIREDLFASNEFPPSASKNLKVPACSRKNEGVLLSDRAKVGDHYVFDTLSSGCNLLFEGRFVSTPHHYIVIERSGTESSSMLLYGLLVYKEGSHWEYPTGWNMQDFSTPKAPIAGEFVNAKRLNMQNNVTTKHDFPITVVPTSGAAVTYEPGKTVDGVVLPDNCAFTEPTKITITALFTAGDPFPYNASIGGQGCRTIAWGSVSTNPGKTTVMLWSGAMDNVLFSDLTAYTIPKTATDEQIVKFYTDQKLTGEVVLAFDATTVLAVSKP